MKTATRQFGRLAVACVLVAATASALAFVLSDRGSAATARVDAASHCTHFTPPYTQDFNCYTWASLTGSGYHDHYHTTSVAKRDSNNFSSSINSNYWSLSFCCLEIDYPSYWGQGYGASTGGTGNDNKYAWCSPLYDGTGACWTNWHD